MSWCLDWKDLCPSGENCIQTPLHCRPAQALGCCVQILGMTASRAVVLMSRLWEKVHREPRFSSAAGLEHSRNSKLHLRCWLFHFNKHLDFVRHYAKDFIIHPILTVILRNSISFPLYRGGSKNSKVKPFAQEPTDSIWGNSEFELRKFTPKSIVLNPTQ